MARIWGEPALLAAAVIGGRGFVAPRGVVRLTGWSVAAPARPGRLLGIHGCADCVTPPDGCNCGANATGSASKTVLIMNEYTSIFIY